MLHRRFPLGLAMFVATLLFLGPIVAPGRIWSAEIAEKSLANEIADLRKEVAALRAENRKLRQLLVEKTDERFVVQPPRARVVPTPSDVSATSEKPSIANTRFWLSSGGKRHNSRCRYFKGAGRACGKDEGVACKVCGG